MHQEQCEPARATEWPFGERVSFELDPRVMNAPHAADSPPGEDIRAFHWADERRQREPSYWISLNATGRKRIPESFGVIVRRHSDDGNLPTVLLDIEMWQARHCIVTVVVQHPSPTGPEAAIHSNRDMRPPIDRYARLGASAITITAKPEAGNEDEWVGYYPNESLDPIRMLRENEDALNREIINRRQAPRSRAASLGEALAVANVYRKDMARASAAPKGAGRRPHPVEAVMREFGWKRSTATRRIALARDLGYLRPALDRRAGEASDPCGKSV